MCRIHSHSPFIPTMHNVIRPSHPMGKEIGGKSEENYPPMLTLPSARDWLSFPYGAAGCRRQSNPDVKDVSLRIRKCAVRKRIPMSFVASLCVARDLTDQCTQKRGTCEGIKRHPLFSQNTPIKPRTRNLNFNPSVRRLLHHYILRRRTHVCHVYIQIQININMAQTNVNTHGTSVVCRFFSI